MVRVTTIDFHTRLADSNPLYLIADKERTDPDTEPMLGEGLSVAKIRARLRERGVKISVESDDVASVDGLEADDPRDLFFHVTHNSFDRLRLFEDQFVTRVYSPHWEGVRFGELEPRVSVIAVRESVLRRAVPGLFDLDIRAGLGFDAIKEHLENQVAQDTWYHLELTRPGRRRRVK